MRYRISKVVFKPFYIFLGDTMITFSEPIEWRNSSVLKVTGVTVRPGTFMSREGIVTPFTPELCHSLFSNFKDSTPSYLTHDDRDPCGYMCKLGYDNETDMIHYEGYVFDNAKAQRIVDENFDSVSPEIEFDMENGIPKTGRITGIAFVRNPAIKGTSVTKQRVAFSTPSHPWDYGKSDKPWSKPALKDFTDKSWNDLSNAEKRDIAGHYAYSANMPPVSFGDLKFPHHEPKSHNVNWGAVTNAMARLNQADISDADKKAVYKHLSSHYKEFDKEPPRMFDNGSVENMNEMNNYSMTSSNGTYIFAPTTTGITSATSYSVPVVDPKDAKIAELEQKLAKFETMGVNPVQMPVVPEVPAVNPVVSDGYKDKYNALMKSQVDNVIGELKNLGAKDVDKIGDSLDVEQRFAMLRALKENIVINKPTTTPPETIITQPVGESKEQKLDKIMKENGIDPSYKKYLKVN